MKLSFIIPAYNAGSTIARTLTSIIDVGLDGPEYEIIVVDDCSVDNTVSVVEEFAQYNLIILRQPENHRQGAARNRGIMEAKGDFIMFVDADDIVEPGVHNALRQAVALDADILFCNYLWMHPDNIAERRQLQLRDGSIYAGTDFCERFYDTTINTCPIAYLWKRTYLCSSGIEFVEDRRMEDYDFIETNLFNAKRVGYSSSVIYRVMSFENLSSTTHSFSYDTEADWVHVAYRRMKFAEAVALSAPSFSERIIAQSRDFVCHRLTFRNLLHLPSGDIKKFYERLGCDARFFLLWRGPWPFFSYVCLKYPYIVTAIYNIEKKLARLFH